MLDDAISVRPRDGIMCNVDCIRWGAKNLTSGEVKGKRIIEVGSYDVNGTLRYIVELLEPAEFVGVDIMEGPGVDVVCPADGLVQDFGEESFDLVLSTCALEHIRDWKKAISNMKRVLKPNGIMLIIVPSRWPYHQYPHDFWRYHKEDVRAILSDFELLVLEEDVGVPSLVYVKARKPVAFVERDLSDYRLHCVMVNKRIREVRDEEVRSLYFRRLILTSKIKGIALKIGRRVFSRVS